MSKVQLPFTNADYTPCVQQESVLPLSDFNIDRLRRPTVINIDSLPCKRLLGVNFDVCNNQYIIIIHDLLRSNAANWLKIYILFGVGGGNLSKNTV